MKQIIGGRCMICGNQTRKEGEPLCIQHDIEALISLSFHRLTHRLAEGYRIASHIRKSVTRKIKNLSYDLIERVD